MSKIQGILTLQQIKGYGKKTVGKILSEFTKFEPNNSTEILNLLSLVKSKIRIPSLPEIEQAWKECEDIIKRSEANEIQILSIDDSRYPRLLKEIPNAPLILHALGNISALNMKSVAVIGTRNASTAGIDAAREFTKELVKQGYCIVSGLAEGIDTAAHTSAIASKGITIAVLAHGLDTIFPPINKKLAEEILDSNGTLLSEYPIGTNYNKGYFIDRDRLQSGLSDATFVIETNIDGGSMHTAAFCLEQGRKLMVLQDNNLKNNDGNNKLISDGASAIKSINDLYNLS
jgi:DNA processing protein